MRGTAYTRVSLCKEPCYQLGGEGSTHTLHITTFSRVRYDKITNPDNPAVIKARGEKLSNSERRGYLI